MEFIYQALYNYIFFLWCSNEQVELQDVQLEMVIDNITTDGEATFTQGEVVQPSGSGGVDKPSRYRKKDKIATVDDLKQEIEMVKPAYCN